MLIYAFLICLPVIGWIALVALIVSNKTKTVYEYLCRDCKKNWIYNPKAKQEMIVNIIGIVVLLPIFAIILFLTIIYFH